MFQELYQFVPDRSVVDVFKVKYDYHNVKAVLKSLAVGADTGRLLVDAGRVPAEKLAKALEEGDYTALPEKMQAPCREAHEVLSATGDPQQSDFILDARLLSGDASGCPGHWERPSEGAMSRLRLMRQTSAPPSARCGCTRGESSSARSCLMAARFRWTGSCLRPLAGAWRTPSVPAGCGLPRSWGLPAIRGGSLTAFEKACDDAVTVCAAQAKAVPLRRGGSHRLSGG